MFNKILIANRGEIACRIMCTAKRLGIQTVAIYSEADKHALHVKMADEAYCVGPAPSHQSYLNVPEILRVAIAASVEAIHPGYGFLSENADFAEVCRKENLCFIGPSPDAIRQMGEKNTAKRLMEQANVPVVKGYHGTNQDAQFLRKQACDIGFPVLIKAVAGGGGKGMRVAESEEAFGEALLAAKNEARASFGNDAVLLEQYLSETRHVELQVFADSHGHAVYLFERDCSIQRRHQKILEEAPAPGMTLALRARMGEAAVNAARAIHYEGAGTVEFLLAPDNAFYFMEMNTRLQVEHPITEKITGLDLVEWQLRVASGEPLPLPNQSDISLHGHAIEARICAENVEKDFAPSIGRLDYFILPEENEHVRIDTGVMEGDSISVYYDPLIAKLIVWDEDRDKAIVRLRSALGACHIAGVSTNVPLLSAIAQNEAFLAARLNTRFIVQEWSNLVLRPTSIPSYIQGMDASSPWCAGDSWRLNLPAKQLLRLQEQTEGGVSDTDKIIAPIPGMVVDVSVASGQLVKKGDRLMVIEAMKMQHTLCAPRDGVIQAVLFAVGDLIEEGVELVSLLTPE